MNNVDRFAKILWDYHHVNHQLTKADCILVLGSHDQSTADYAIDLFKQGWAPLILFSGGRQNPLLKSNPSQPEAHAFSARAIERGVPPDKILQETKSMNTGENFTLSADLLKRSGLNPGSFIVVQKPYMERRTLATGLIHWPEKKLIITSPRVSYEEYVGGAIPKTQIIDFMVGDLQRIKIYGEKGFQTHQEIPKSVWDAYLELVKLGFTTRLLQEP